MTEPVRRTSFRHRLLSLIYLFVIGPMCAAACSDSANPTAGEAQGQTGIRVTFDFGPDLAVDQLSLDVAPQGQPESGVRQTLPAVPRALESGMQIAFMVPPAWHGDLVAVQVTALNQGRPVAQGNASATIFPEKIVDLTVSVTQQEP